LRQPLGVAIVGGLLLSQLLTLTHEHYNLELRSPGQVVRNDQGAEASRGPPAAFPSGSGSRVTLTAIRRASSFVSIFARRASASLPRE
jgi:hypothetical protein